MTNYIWNETGLEMTRKMELATGSSLKLFMWEKKQDDLFKLYD